MVDKPTSGTLFGVPYNFERPSMKRLLEAYWQPGRGMLVEKPFGVGYTLNLANWRSWLVVALVGVLAWRERSSEETAEEGEEPVEVVVDD
ncbi:MAG: DUF5808 domain-containing protein [Halanaeroarchaeum sp.]